MARKPRIEFPGALYHIMARGNKRSDVFFEDSDFKKYLHILSSYKKQFQFKLFAYTLMKNHVHLLIETGDIPLSKIMQGIQQSYTQYFNWKYEQVGHVFQGRYKAILCQKDTYLLTLIKYIHLNPVRSGIVKDPLKYKWTSHQFYLSRKPPLFVDAEIILRYFDSKVIKRAKKYYLNFINEEFTTTAGDLEESMNDPRILGDEIFTERVIKQSLNNQFLNSQPKYSLDDLLKSICNLKKILPESLKSNTKERRIVMARRIFCYCARFICNFPLDDIKRFLDIEESTVINTAKYVFVNLDKDRNLEKDIKKIVEAIESQMSRI